MSCEKEGRKEEYRIQKTEEYRKDAGETPAAQKTAWGKTPPYEKMTN